MVAFRNRPGTGYYELGVELDVCPSFSGRATTCKCATGVTNRRLSDLREGPGTFPLTTGRRAMVETRVP